MSCLEEGNLLKSCVVSAYGFIITEGKRRFKENREKIRNYEEYRWLVEYDFSKFNDAVEKRLCRTKFGKLLVRTVHK